MDSERSWHGWMLGRKTNPACTIHKDRMWLPPWLDYKMVTKDSAPGDIAGNAEELWLGARACLISAPQQMTYCCLSRFVPDCKQVSKQIKHMYASFKAHSHCLLTISLCQLQAQDREKNKHPALTFHVYALITMWEAWGARLLKSDKTLHQQQQQWWWPWWCISYDLYFNTNDKECEQIKAWISPCQHETQQILVKQTWHGYENLTTLLLLLQVLSRTQDSHTSTTKIKTTPVQI